MITIELHRQNTWKSEYPIFLSEKYLKSESSNYGYFIASVEKTKIAILPFVIYKKAIFSLLRFTYQCYFFNPQDKIQYAQEFMDGVIDKLSELNVDMVMQPSTNVLFSFYPQKAIYAPFGSYKLDLTLKEEELWSNLHSKHRNVIRNAEKKGIVIEENKYEINELHSLMTETFARSNMGFISKEEFTEQIDSLGKNVKVFIARTSEGVIQGCAVFPYSQFGAYYLHGGSISKPLTGAMNFLHWKAILSFKEEDVETYDFVGARISPGKGTKLDGIQKFKARFGATLEEGYLWKYPVKKWKYKLFTQVYKFLKKKEGDIIDQERDRNL